MKKTFVESCQSWRGNRNCFSLLFICMTMFMGLAACSDDPTEEVAAPMAMDDASLIESQLKLLRTRANDATTTVMITTKTSIELSVGQVKPLIVDWGDGNKEIIPDGKEMNQASHVYTDDFPAHTICFYGEKDTLINLSCSVQELIFLDVSKNIALTNLVCLSNRLTQLDVSQNIVLQFLTCCYNSLSIVNVANNHLLIELDCGGSKLSCIDVSKNPNLKHLNCQSCDLDSLDISNNTHIRSLLCDNNKLKKLDLSKNIDLEQIMCNDNQLIALDFSKNPKMSSVFSFYNLFESNFNEVLKMVASLPDRTGLDPGFLLISDVIPNLPIIESVHTAKNWAGF